MSFASSSSSSGSSSSETVLATMGSEFFEVFPNRDWTAVAFYQEKLGIAQVPLLGWAVEMITVLTTRNYIEHVSVQLRGRHRKYSDFVDIILEFGDYGLRLHRGNAVEQWKAKPAYNFSGTFNTFPRNTVTGEALETWLHNNWNRGSYNAVTRNCQHFIDDITRFMG